MPMNLSTEQKSRLPTDTENNRTVTKAGSWGGGSDKLGVWDPQIHTAVYKLENNQDLYIAEGTIVNIFFLKLV